MSQSTETGAGPSEGRPPATPAADFGPRREWIGGAVLIVVGLLFLLSQLAPDLGRYIVLIVGLGLLGLFAATRGYGFLVPGGIVTGVGVGIVLAVNAGRDGLGGGLFLLSLGGGFVAVWLLGFFFRVPQNHWWPLIPGAVLALIGLPLLLAAEDQEWPRIWWPLALVAVGLLLVLSGFLRRRT